MLGRSLDGGETWTIEDPGKTGNMVPHGLFMAVRRTDVQPQASIDCRGDINFQHPDFALKAHSDDVDAGQSRFWYSYDRGHMWEGPCDLPDFGAKGTAARTDLS